MRSQVNRTALFIIALFAPRATFAQQNESFENFEKLEKIAKTYRIEIISDDPEFPIQTRHGAIEGKGADKEEVLEYIPLFAQEFKLYPRELIRRSRLKRVVLCCELSFAGQRRTAIPDFGNDTLYLDVSRGSQTYLRKVVHHEFYHVIDWQDDCLVYEDKQWAALNPDDFKYGTGGRNAQDKPDTSVLTDKFPGFLNHYSTTGVEEDKAELFANLIVDSDYVAKRVEKDQVLDAKVKLLKKQLIEFCPALNEEFWESIEKTKRNETDRSLFEESPASETKADQEFIAKLS